MQLRVRSAGTVDTSVDTSTACVVSAATLLQLGRDVDMLVLSWRGNETLVPVVSNRDVFIEDVRIPPLVARRLGLPHLDSSHSELWLDINGAHAATSCSIAKHLLLKPVQIRIKDSVATSASMKDQALQQYFATIERYVAVGDAIYTAPDCWYVISEVHDNSNDSKPGTIAMWRTIPSRTSLSVADASVRTRLPDMCATAALAASNQKILLNKKSVEHGDSSQESNLYLHLLRTLQTALCLTYTPTPYMLTYSSADCIQPRDVLARASAALGLPLYVLDARLLWEWGSGRMSSIPGLADDDGCNKYGITGVNAISLACNANTATISTYSPCVLLIEGLDHLAADAHGTETGGDGDEPLDAWAAGAKRFIAELQMQTSSHIISPKSLTMGTNIDYNSSICENTILIVAETKTESPTLPRSVHRVFPASLSSNSYKVNNDMKNNVPSVSKLVKDVPLDIRESVRNALSILGASEVSVQALRREAHIHAVNRRQLPYWCGAIGLNKLHEDSSDVNHAIEDPLEHDPWHKVSPVDVVAACDILHRTYHSFNSNSKKNTNNNIASVKWEDIGGLDNVRHEIIDLIELPRQRPELFPPGCPVRRAVLLFGPPGTGKTLVARAVATECNMYFMSVKGPELLDVYVGESEANVRHTFAHARLNQPCVIFFDELDALAPARGRGGDGGGVMDRVVAQLLTEMDSLSECSNNPDSGVFVIGATNRPDLLDAALMRPGRFDRAVYLSPCRQAAARLSVLQAQTRSIALHTNVDLLTIANTLPGVVTGADIGSVVSMAIARAQKRMLKDLRKEARIATDSSLEHNDTITIFKASHEFDADKPNDSSNDSGTSSEEEEDDDKIWDVAAYINALPSSRLQLELHQQDLLYAIANLRPSVSASELRHYETLASTYGAQAREQGN
jgi:ATP-dependent 26S proteasome regulatory subunit